MLQRERILMNPEDFCEGVAVESGDTLPVACDNKMYAESNM